MNKFLAIAMAALMVLSFVSVASAADSVEVRGQVVGDDFEWNATTFAGFWIDIDTGEFSEYFELVNEDGTIPEDYGIVYNAYPVDDQEPEFAFLEDDADDAEDVLMYEKIGFLAEEYFVVDGDLATLSKILVDDDESYTLRTGESLELEDGYAVTPKQIDVDGNKVWLELTKDGDFVEDKIISTAEVDLDSEKTWYFQMDLNDNEDVNVVMVHIDEVFQGQVDSLCVIDGLFQISDDPLVLDEDDEFGELTITSLDESIELTNDENELDMPDDDTLEITDTLGIRANEDTTLWYLYTEYTEPGTYEIRGTLADDDFEWDADSFAGFWYDLDEGDFSEYFELVNEDGTIPEDYGIVYNAYPVDDQEPEFGFLEDDADDAEDVLMYEKIGFLAEEYFVVDGDLATLSMILVDDDESYTLRTGESLELEDGYAVTPKQIDVDGNKVWLELTKDGDFVEDKIISTAEVDLDSEKTWYFQMDLNDNEDVNVIMVHIDEVFQGQVDSLCVIDGLFQISDDPLVLDEDDEFGELTITSLDESIEMTNDDNELDMPDDDTLEITDTLGIRANEDTTLWYLYTEVTIEGDMVEEPEEVEEEVEEPVDENVTEPVDENVTEPVDENVTEVDEPVEEPTEDEVPGFEAVFAIAGLLAVAYFVRRN